MPAVTQHHDGQPTWVDLVTTDPQTARDFYQRLFGWQFEVFGADFGNYSIARRDGADLAGIGPVPSGAPPISMWNLYLTTADVDASFAEALSAGAVPVMPEPMDVPDTGRMAMVADPAGAVVGLWQGSTMAGFGRAGEPGAFAWAEQWSHDVAASEAFYTSVFGYDVNDMSDSGFVYKTLRIEGTDVLGFGLMDPSWGQVPPHWSVYFGCPDTDDTVERAVALGGTVEGEPMDTPYGRIATVVDPLGARFRVLAGAAEQTSTDQRATDDDRGGPTD
jgi:predicted enzyme related to lactoylglutathione lyase